MFVILKKIHFNIMIMIDDMFFTDNKYFKWLAILEKALRIWLQKLFYMMEVEVLTAQDLASFITSIKDHHKIIFAININPTMVETMPGYNL